MILEHITSVGRYANVTSQPAYDTIVVAATGWPSVQRAIYIPIIVPEPFTVARFFSANNSTTGNDDVGLYSAAGARLLSTGSQARTAACNYYDVADTAFAAGFYYLAESSNNTGQHFTVPLGINALRYNGLLEEAAAFPLPATMTGVAVTANYCPVIGFTQSGTL